MKELKSRNKFLSMLKLKALTPKSIVASRTFIAGDVVYVIDNYNTYKITKRNDLLFNKPYHVKEIKDTKHIILEEYPNVSFKNERFILEEDYLANKFNI